MDTLHRLENKIRTRQQAKNVEISYTAQMLAKGHNACAQKFGEEAVELIIAATNHDKPEIIAEAADTLYHMLIMCCSCDVDLDDVLAELKRRDGMSGLEEKATRN